MFCFNFYCVKIKRYNESIQKLSGVLSHVEECQEVSAPTSVSRLPPKPHRWAALKVAMLAQISSLSFWSGLQRALWSRELGARKLFSSKKLSMPTVLSTSGEHHPQFLTSMSSHSTSGLQVSRLVASAHSSQKPQPSRMAHPPSCGFRRPLRHLCCPEFQAQADSLRANEDLCRFWLRAS